MGEQFGKSKRFGKFDIRYSSGFYLIVLPLLPQKILNPLKPNKMACFTREVRKPLSPPDDEQIPAFRGNFCFISEALNVFFTHLKANGIKQKSAERFCSSTSWVTRDHESNPSFSAFGRRSDLQRTKSAKVAKAKSIKGLEFSRPFLIWRFEVCPFVPTFARQKLVYSRIKRFSKLPVCFQFYSKLEV